ncbi:unnamed protein product, partial [Mesorhabditis belari]|uniref:Uncharacterized protein n=1 Tax=Mesorhabditis belari TaxID=2138241 RepID=A0AAF3EQP9_9BILA
MDCPSYLETGDLPKTFPPQAPHQCTLQTPAWIDFRQSNKIFLAFIATLFILVDMSFLFAHHLKDVQTTWENVYAADPFDLVHTIAGTTLPLIYIAFYLCAMHAVVFTRPSLLRAFEIYLGVAIIINVLHLIFHIITKILYETLIIIVVDIVWSIVVFYVARSHVHYMNECITCY